MKIGNFVPKEGFILVERQKDDEPEQANKMIYPDGGYYTQRGGYFNADHRKQVEKAEVKKGSAPIEGKCFCYYLTHTAFTLPDLPNEYEVVPSSGVLGYSKE